MPTPGHPKAGESMPANDYAANMAKVADTKEQSVPPEQGNNAPQEMAGPGKPSKGDLNIKGGASYMEGMPAASAGE